MSASGSYASTWRTLLDLISRVVKLRTGRPPIVLSSLPWPPANELAEAHSVSFIQGPPGRNIAIAIGLRAALPDTPLLLIMNSDAITLGTNHLSHAARRNIGMTLLLLRSDLTDSAESNSLDRMRWGSLGFQEDIEAAATPLAWATALDAALVARGNIGDPDQSAKLINQAIDTPGFSLVGLTSVSTLGTGVLSRVEWPEYFDSYRKWAEPMAALAAGEIDSVAAPVSPRRQREVPRHEFRVAGLGGQGVKLAGSILSEAADIEERLWATQRGEYGSATRGGPSMVDVVVSSERITYPGADHPDVLVALSQAAADLHGGKVKWQGSLVCDSDLVERPPQGALSVPVVRLAREHAGRPISAGVAALGCVAAVCDVVSLDAVRQAVSRKVPLHTVDKNVAALEAAYEAACAARGNVA